MVGPIGDTIRRRSTTSATYSTTTDLSKVFITAAYDALNKAYDLFSMMDGVDKHLAVIEDERRLMGRVLEGGFIDIPYLTGHEFGARLPNVTAKIKEANEMMGDALEDAKLQYKNINHN